MKISNSKKQLAKIIRDNGGWREGAKFSAQDSKRDSLPSRICFYRNKPELGKGGSRWLDGNGRGVVGNEDGCINGAAAVSNWHQSVLSRDEYFHLYPESDADGWIEWNGGECPVDGDSVIDVKLSDGDEFFGVDADWDWHQGSGCNIIAYRLHKPEQAKPEFCESVMRSITEPEAKPTIEQLAAEYRNRKDYAERKQQEADAAKAEAEAKLKELVAAGKVVGLVVSVAAQEPVITDWRDLQVGDEIEYLGGTTGYWIGRKGVVELISGKDEYPILFRDGEEGVSEDPSNWDSTRWCNDFRFIRRPAKEADNA